MTRNSNLAILVFLILAGGVLLWAFLGGADSHALAVLAAIDIVLLVALLVGYLVGDLVWWLATRVWPWVKERRHW